MRRAVAGLDRVPQGAVVEFDVGHALACIFHRLLDRDRHFARLAVAEADLAVAVTDHRQRGEGELATALDRLGDAVDGDELLDHPVRSEEHTSELQSLMRISYAVFCLKTKHHDNLQKATNS